MAKFDEISRLYDETAAKVTESPEEWLKFVGTASNLYRYPFEDQLLIYAQRPDAKQAATMDFWNRELHCYVNKGAKGIALLDKSKRGNRLKYVFDMSDVHKVSDRSRMPYQWELSDAFKNDVADYLEGKHIGYASTDMDFEDRIIRIADHIAADNIDEFYDSISEKTDGSALSEVYEENRKEVVQDALSASVASMLLTRCGLDPSECEDRLTGLQYINMFNTKATVSELGNLVSTLAKPVLVDIEREVFRLSREKNIQVDNIINKEHNQSKESERSEENGSRVHTERGLSDTEPESTGNIGRDTGSIDESREIRTGEGEIPARTQEGDLLGLSDERNTGGTPDRDRQTGIRTERADDAANEESKGRESRNAGKELVGVLSGGSDDRSRGGINDNGRDDLRLEENEDKQLSLFPTEKEQVESIEAAEKSAAFSMTDDLKLAVERAVKNHDTIYIQEPEEFHFSDQPYPVANANLEKFTNERLAYEEESDSYLLLADTEHDKGVWLRVFDLADEEPGRVAKELCDYIESHQMSVTGIVAHEDLAEKDYVFRIYAGAAVSEPVLWEDVITAHSYQEAQNIAEKLADGKPYSINDVDELVSRAEPVIQNGERQEELQYKNYLIQTYETPIVGSPTISANIVNWAYDSIEDVAEAAQDRVTGGVFYTVKEVESDNVPLEMNTELSKEDTLYIGKEHFADKIREIDPKPGTDIDFSVYDGESFSLSWHEPAGNVNFYPLVNVQGEHKMNREGGENPESWKHFLHEIADGIDGKDTAKDIQVPWAFDEIQMGDQVYFNPDNTEKKRAEDLTVGDIVMLPENKMSDMRGRIVTIPAQEATVTEIEARSDGETEDLWISFKGKDGSLTATSSTALNEQGFSIIGHDKFYDRQELSVGEEYLINMDSSELARKFAKSAVAWDEIDSLGFAFNGWQGEQHPMFTENSLFGKNLHGDELINLAYRFRDGFTEGTDDEFRFDRDLSLGLLGEKGGFELDSVGMDYEVRNGHFVISRGDVSRELSFEQVSNAYLTMFREEYERNIEPEEEFEETQDVRYVGLDSFDLVADDIRNIHYVSSEYSNFGHTAEHELTAKIEGKTQNLHYEVNYGDGDDESFSIHTDENDIYDRMPTPEIRKLEGRLNDEVRVGRYAEKIEKAESAEELNNIRYEFMEDEKFPTRLSGRFWEAYNAAEEKFIEPVQGTYRIYQMKDGEEYHYAHFEPMDILEKEGIKLNRDDYNLMYEGDLSEIKGADDNDRLQAIFDKFGNNYEGSRPENFKGYSLSVSDVITFDKGNGEEPHFVDSFGFKDFPGFLQDKELARDSEEVTLPNVKVQWSESSLFEDGKTYSVAEYDSIMHEADLTRHSKQQELEEKYGSFDAWLESGDQTEYAGYDKTKFTVNFKDGSYVTERHDIGDGIGGLLEFMAQYDNFADKMPELREAAGREEDKQSYQLVIHNKNARGENPYRKKAAYRTEKEASAVGKEWISNSSVYDGYGVYNLETGRIENAVGNFTADIPVYDGILGEDFKEKYTIALEADAEELENLNSLADNNFSDLLTLSDGDYLVDNDGILWNVENAGDFMLRLDVAEENKVDTLITTRSYMMWQDKVQKNGTFDDYTNYRPITVEDYLKERKEAAYVSEVMQQKKDLGIDVQPLNPDEVEIITGPEEPEIDTEKLEEQIDILKDENIGFRSLIDRDDVSVSEKAEYRSKLTANLNEIERLGGIVANERIRVSEQADSVEIKDTDRWKLVSEADPYSDSGTLTEWATQLKDGSYVWIDKEGESYAVYNVPYTDRKPMAEFPTLDEAKDYAESELIPVIEEAALGQNILKTPEELSGTEFIVQLPDEMQKKIREAVSLVDGADVETAMSGRLTDLEDNINWREVLSSDISQKQEKTAEKSGNFHITDYDLGKGGAKEKCQRNIDAIKTLLKVEKEGRAATPEEQAVMSQYIGWGGLADVFDERKANWNVERLELKRILSDDEFAAARSSTTDAFYTSPEVIDGIYGTLDRMGFEKGNILEPSMGVGNFFGMLPEKMQGSKLYGVELDSISGRIGKQLYPDARIQISGYQDTNFSNNSFDVAVGNVPFGDYKPFDRDYKKQNFVLHDYFFAKTLDKVRPGGVIAFVTSKGTMDKEDPKVRKYIAQRAEFLGAVRLPGGKDGAFKENAGTEVTSDIIFLQKRDGIADVDPDWVHLSMDKNGIAMNSYFAEHPEQIVGHMEMVSGRFGPEAACIADKDKPFKEQYVKALLGISGRYAAAERNGKDTQDYAETLLPSPEDKNYSFIVRNDRVYFRKNTELIPKELKSDAEERIKGMVEIRDLTQNLLNMQLDDAKESEIATAQIKLGEAYDTFVKKYGRINSPKNKSAFQQDSSYSLLRSLEKYDDNNEYQGKSDIFTKRTIQKAVVVSSVESASEALSVCLNEKAAVDIPFMAKLCHKPENEVIEDLRGIIFKNPLTERYETSDEYLSGNVRSKLALAKNYAEQNPEYAINVAALEAVQPKELSAGDIDVRLGASWIDPKYINDFMREVLDTSWYEMRNGTIGVSFNDVTASWWIEGKTKDRYNSKVNQVYGTERKNAYELLEDSLNLKATTVYDSWIDENGCRKSEINKQATMAAQQKQDELKETFKSWIFQDPQRRQELVTLYNEKFNSTRPREYNGDYITLPGSNPQITLKPHQKNAVARIISGNNTLLAHCVGAGKTFTMAAAAMESKRLGLCKKSLFVVPNHLTEQWGSEFRTLYPNANILVATKKDFEPARRKEFCARIATGDYDAVIIGHTQFEKIPVSPEKEAAFIQSEIDNAKRTIEELSYSKADRHSVKDIEKFIKKRTEQLDKMLHSKERDDVVTFEQLGVDRLFVDESHKFKNLGMITKMNRVAGVQTSDSQKSNDMLMKCRVMDEITGGKGVTFATGTPISNSMTELYTNMRYLQQSTLEKLDLAHFDKWASTFGETVTAMEVSPEGTSYRAKTRFAKFFNLPELMSIWKEAADVQTPDMLNLPVPETEYVDVVLDKSPEQEAILDVIGKRADVIRAGGIDSKIDNMLKITNDGRKMALDQRLINDMLPDNPNSKAAACAENIASIYKDTMEQKSAQIVFCDLGTPSANGKNDKFNVYNDLKEKLIEKGIPAEEIAFIHDAKTETQKDTLFSNVRSGKVRVIIGSTEKMGAGTNIQDRLIALHHMDVPWRPADLEQQEGRIIRRGNQNSKVKIFRYITKGTFDTYNWQTIENKQTFIGQIMTSKSPVRSHEDIDNAALKYAEVKALATDNPLIAEKMNLEVEVQKLKAAKVSHNNQIYAMQDNVTKTYPESIAKDKELIKAFKKDILTYNEHKPADKDSFSITIGNRTFVDKKEGAEALQDAIKSGAKYVGDYGKIGSYRGFDVMVKLDLLFNKFDLKLSGETAHQVMDVGHDAFGNVNKMNNVLDGMPQNLEKIVQRLEKTEKSLEVAKVEMTKPFPKEEELKEKMQRLSEVDSLLRMDEKEPVIIDTGDEMDTPTKACEDISEMVEDKSETKIFGVSYRNEKDFGNMVYLECDNEDIAKDFVKDLIPGCTVERGIEVSKVPEGKQVFNVAKEKERMAQKALEKAGKGKTANGIE